MLIFMNKSVPSIWFLAALSGINGLTEGIFSPSLPAIAQHFQTSPQAIKYSLNLFLVGYAIGNIFFGMLADFWGRRASMLLGIILFIVTSGLCCLAPNVGTFFLCMFFLGTFCAACVIICRAIIIDTFTGQKLAQSFSKTIGMTVLLTSLSPILGGTLFSLFSWQGSFYFLVVLLICPATYMTLTLKETAPKLQPRLFKLKDIKSRICKLLKDKVFVSMLFIFACCKSFVLAYLIESSFALIKNYGLSPLIYGQTFFFIAAAGAMGAVASHRLNKSTNAQNILKQWTPCLFIPSFFLLAITLIDCYIFSLPDRVMIVVFVATQMVVMYIASILSATAQAIALTQHKNCAGLSAGFFSAAHYSVTSLMLFVMGVFHNGGLVVLPALFVGLSFIATLAYIYSRKELTKLSY